VENIDLSLKSTDSEMKTMVNLLKTLSKKTAELPRVDGKGQSECGWAEDLYAENEELIKKVTQNLKKLREHLSVVEKVITGHRKNLDQIRMDANSLHLSKAKKQYSFAELSQEFLYKKALEKKKALEDLFSWAEKVLNLAREKRFPGGEPRKKFRPPPEFSASMEGRPANNPTNAGFQARPASGPSFANQINDLMSLGPIGGRTLK
jgi:hypothetical protein